MEKFMRAEIIYKNKTKIIEKIKNFKEVYNDFLIFYDKKNNLMAVVPKKNIIIIEIYEEDF